MSNYLSSFDLSSASKKSSLDYHYEKLKEALIIIKELFKYEIDNKRYNDYLSLSSISKDEKDIISSIRSYKISHDNSITCMLLEIARDNLENNFHNDLEDKSLYRQTREFSIAELAQYDGSMGKPAYVAIDGIVYDVSNAAAWGGGTHFGLIAGRDLTLQFQSCHGNESILSMLPKIGTLKV